VRDTVLAVLGHSAVADDEPLMAAGLDSLGAVELRSALEGRLGGQGLMLPPTLVFDYPTTAALAGFVSDQLGVSDAPLAAAAAPVLSATASPLALHPLDGAAAPPPTSTAVAITGTACRSPCSAIQSAPATDAIRSVPLARWDWERLGGASSAAAGVAFADASDSGGADWPARFGGWLDGIELFDAALFGISGAEAELMDAQQRLLVEATHHAIWSANSSRTTVSNSSATAAVAGGAGGLAADACVAVGIASAEYNNWVLRRAGHPPAAYSATGGALSVASGRLAYVYGMRGAAVSVDTACSSSLVATYFAAGQISGGRASGGIAGGVGLILCPEPTAMFAKAGMLAPDGRCKTLDAAADGYVRAEAVGVLVLQALRSGSDSSSSAPLALLAGSAVNQDGRSSGLTAPNGPAQQEVVRSALVAAGLSPAAVTGVEMHGTGTGLGDPIEVGALAAALVGKGNGSNRSQPLVLTAGKSWVGHSEAAAGAIGLLHATAGLVSLQAQAVLHLAATNPYLEAALRPSPASDGLSSMAAGGSWSLPRQAAGLPFVGGGHVRGVSSFAFQVRRLGFTVLFHSRVALVLPKGW
jgi:acyl transferase domain-containing protein